jgi:hypothetical protein
MSPYLPHSPDVARLNIMSKFLFLTDTAAPHHCRRLDVRPHLSSLSPSSSTQLVCSILVAYSNTLAWPPPREVMEPLLSLSFHLCPFILVQPLDDKLSCCAIVRLAGLVSSPASRYYYTRYDFPPRALGFLGIAASSPQEPLPDSLLLPNSLLRHITPT